VVGVHRHDIVRALRRHAGVGAVVGPDVPYESAALAPGRGGDEFLLGPRVGFAVGVVVAVGRPGRAVRPPAQPLDQLAQASHVRTDELGGEAGPPQLAFDLAALGRGVTALEPAVQDDVGQHSAPQQVAHRHRGARFGRGDAVDRAAQPGMERDPAVGLEHQGIEEERAELAVADPRLALAQALEGADVDVDRGSAAPLHVVGRAVLEHQAGVERALDELEVQKRRVAQHPEGPLVRVGHERNALVLEHAGALLLEDRRPVTVRLPRAHQAAALDHLMKERRRLQGGPVLPGAGA
jgi:hypothetical protein